MKQARVVVVYESGASGRAWKGDRVSDLLSSFHSAGFAVKFLGLRGIFGAPFILRRSLSCIFFAFPGQVSRFARLFNASHRDVRTAVSQRIFSAATYFCRNSNVITQTTLGGLVRKFKQRGHVVWAECDMTCPTSWRNVLLEEANRCGDMREIQSELPSRRREAEEKIAFKYADKVIVFSSWAAENLSEGVRKKTIMVPAVSVKPEVSPLVNNDDDSPIELLFVGQVCFRKGFHNLMEALGGAEGEDCTCHVFGSVRDNFRSYTDRKGLRFPSSMVIHGPGDWRSFIRSNPRRYVAILPSLVEGSPRFIYEAAAFGIPSIVTPAACPSILSHNEDALVLPDVSSEEIRKAMLRFKNEPELWRRLAGNTFSCYSRHYEKGSFGREVAVRLLAGE